MRKTALVNQTADEANGKKKEVHPVLAPLLIALFMLLIFLIAFIFFRGIRKNLKLNKADSEKQPASKINESRVLINKNFECVLVKCDDFYDK